MPSTSRPDRRDFLKTGAIGFAAAGLSLSRSAPASAGSTERSIKKAVKFGMVQGEMPVVEKFKLLKELGFDGVDMDSPSRLNREEIVRARDKSGLVIHGAVDSVHWHTSLSDPNPEVRARGVEALKTALADVKFYGGTTVLLVPAVVNKDVSYAEAYERSQAEIRKVLPLASELGVKIALENVWNQFLLSPLEMARYIDEFESPMIGAYFDVGNVVTYGWPEQWIRILDGILKLDIKEYSRKLRDQQGPGKGFDVEIGDGDCDWPAVMGALGEIGYQGWATAEVRGGDRQRLADISRRMDRIFAT